MAKDDLFKGTPYRDFPYGAKKFRINFSPQEHEETRWSVYRARVLAEHGFADPEIRVLKFNRFTNPRVKQLLRDIEHECRKIREKYGLSDMVAAYAYRRSHFEMLVDDQDIEEADPYVRMGYYEEKGQIVRTAELGYPPGYLDEGPDFQI